MYVAVCASANVVKTDAGYGYCRGPGYDAALTLPARSPLAVASLNEGSFVSDDDLSAFCISSGYENDRGMLIPGIFRYSRDETLPEDLSEITPSPFMNTEVACGKHPSGLKLARDTKELAWSQIVDAGADWPSDSRVVRTLDGAWDTTKRSREYLNAGEGDIDTRYYMHAYNLPPHRDASRE